MANAHLSWFQTHFVSGKVLPRAARPTAWHATWLKPCANRWGGANFVVENVNARAARSALPAAKAAPDGYTPLLHHTGMASSPALYRKPQHKTLEDPTWHDQRSADDHHR
jgi:hypothetical protein